MMGISAGAYPVTGDNAPAPAARPSITVHVYQKTIHACTERWVNAAASDLTTIGIRAVHVLLAAQMRRHLPLVP